MRPARADAGTSSSVERDGRGRRPGPARRQQPGPAGGPAAGPRTHGGRIARGPALAIKKAIPVAGGLAGGSANGAAALLACAVLWDIDVDPEPLRTLAAELGSDVPFALLGGTAVGSGRGEEVVAGPGSRHATTGSSPSVTTVSRRPAVYRRFDQLKPAPAPPEVPAGADERAARRVTRHALGAALVNDLQPAALDLQPRLRQVLDAGLELGALGALVSRSGPDLAFLVGDESAAVDLSVALSAEGLCRTVRRAFGPVSGARLMA